MNRQPIKLKRPLSGGCAGGLVGLVALLIGLLFQCSNAPRISLPTGGRPPGAAQPVVPPNGEAVLAEARKLMEEAKVGGGEPDRALASGRETTVNGVTFGWNLPPGWKAKMSGRQVFLTKPGDGRTIQLVVDASAEPVEASADEIVSHFESLSRQIAAAVAPRATHSLTSKTLQYVNDGTQYRCLIQLDESLKFGNRSLSTRKLVQVINKGNKRIDFQTSNLFGSNGEVETIARSIEIK